MLGAGRATAHRWRWHPTVLRRSSACASECRRRRPPENGGSRSCRNRARSCWRPDTRSRSNRRRAMPPAFPMPPIVTSAFRSSPIAAAFLGLADLVLMVTAPDRDTIALDAARHDLRRLADAAAPSRGGARAGGREDHRVRHRRRSPHHPRPVDGHAVVDGQYRRLQRRPARRRRAQPVLPDAHHRGRNGVSRQGVRHRRRRGGTAGDRHRPASRRQRRGHRRAAGSQGADRERRRQVRGNRAEGERRRGRRLREGAVRGRSPPAERAARPGMRPVRRRHHDGADRRRVRPAADLGRHREDDEAGIGDRRSRRRWRRQLRAVEAGGDGARRRRHRSSRR